ncbi:MAG: hypothetical protein WBM40_15600 [Thiohalocapsa sp.]
MNNLTQRNRSLINRGATLIVMLGGGNKSSQSRDIAKAIELANALED